MIWSPPSPVKQATPLEIKQRLDAGEDLLLIDVREPDEYRTAAIPNTELYPLSKAEGWLDSMPRDRELVIVCHHGGRSMHVALMLAKRGFTKLTNLRGGIDLWSQQVDPTIPRY